ncbi:MAG: PAS domain S-box protein [Rhodanobacteraceae bacterium]|nr:MAG: PAS domain S-box protein [Rhodanobacteraceae bacterium]
MARRGQYFSIIEAIPRARIALRWCGWLGIALLVVPAVVLAVLVATDVSAPGGDALHWALGLVGLVALVAAGGAAVLVLSTLRRMTELTQLLCERGNGPVLVKDTRHRYRFVNEAAAALIGRTPADIRGRSDGELDPGGRALVYDENDRVCLERDLPTLFRESQQTADGVHSFLIAKYPLHDTRGRIAGLVGVARDITDELALQGLERQHADEQRFWFALNPEPVVLFAGADLQVVDANPAAQVCYGYDRPRLLQMHLPELFAPDESGRLAAYLRRDGRSLPPGSVGWQQRRADGELFDAVTDMGSIAHGHGLVHVMRVRDVSALHAAQRAAAAAQARYEDLIESGLAMVWMHDMDGRLLRVNGAMASALGYEREHMVGRDLADFVATDAREHWDDYRARTRSLKRDEGLLHFISSNGERRVWQYQFVCYPEARPVPYVLGSAQDVTLRHRYESKMRDQNRRDPLTGCRTRRFIDTFALQATPDQVWGCIFVDIDYFRQLNSSEGRERGDEVLRELARVLLHHAGPEDEVVRMGGDEFVLVVSQTTADALRERAQQLAAVSRDGMPVVFSIGWAAREGGESLDSTLRRADKMLLHERMRERG